nr:hypothetical protein CFP56_23485 [Quercus suber]
MSVYHPPAVIAKEANQLDGATEALTCNLHEPINDKQNVGPSLNVHGSALEDVPESMYGPWIIVIRKKQGTKQQRGVGTTMNLAHGQPRAGKETQYYMTIGAENLSTGLSPSGLSVEKAHSRPGKELKYFKPNDRGRQANAAFKPNTYNPLASVKGKKGIARNREALSIRASTDEGDNIVGLLLPRNTQGRNLIEAENGSGKRLSGTHPQNQFSFRLKAFVGYQFRGGSGSDQGTCIIDQGRGQHEIKARLEVQPLSNGEECDGGQLVSPRVGVSGREDSLVDLHGGPVEGGRDERSDMGFATLDNTNRVSSHTVDYADKGEAIDRESELDCMELEGVGEGTPAYC